MRDVRVKRQQTIDPRVVVNPQQAKALLDAVRVIEPTVHGFFALLYYGAAAGRGAGDPEGGPHAAGVGVGPDRAARQLPGVGCGVDGRGHAR
jgi:hypothetical protein